MIIVARILYFIFSRKRFGFLKAFKWNKSDFGWLLAAPKHYFVGGGDMPPQEKYNTGQKMFYLCAIVFGFLLAVSGLILWFNLFSSSVVLIMLFLHDLSSVMLILFLFVYFYLVAFLINV